MVAWSWWRVDLSRLREREKGEIAPMKYLVIGSGGPGFTSPEEAVEVLEEGILPTFDALMKLEEDDKILAGGLPIGDRAFVVHCGSGVE
jgi:hypothetical protein